MDDVVAKKLGGGGYNRRACIKTKTGRGGEVMLQRRLAILLSVCMLASGNGSTVYAMNPQASVQTVSDMQGGSDTGEAV